MLADAAVGALSRITGLSTFAAVVCLVTPSLAQTPPVGPDFSKVTIKTTDLGNRTYMLEGFGGNITVAVGDNGVIMVDCQYAPLHDKIKAAIADVTPQPVKYLVNTHHHGDHTGGNGPFAKDGVNIVAHENVKKRMADGWTHNLSGVTSPPAAAEALPAMTYTDSIVLEVKGRAAQLKHPLNAHTDGDTYVYFADANVLATGDTFTNGRYPNSDFFNGGNIKGMIAAVDGYLALINDQTKIVPGHGPLANKTDLAAFREMLVTSRDRMANLIAEGKGPSEADAQAVKPFADLDAKWAANEQASRNWVRVVYNSMKP
jgi:glyoxylase-like metal-dependent hydrolase (beta-lactamase superfamily II)